VGQIANCWRHLLNELVELYLSCIVFIEPVEYLADHFTVLVVFAQSLLLEEVPNRLQINIREIISVEKVENDLKTKLRQSF